MTEKEKLEKLREFVEEQRSIIQEERRSLGYSESLIERALLDRSEAMLDQVAQILEEDA